MTKTSVSSSAPDGPTALRAMGLYRRRRIGVRWRLIAGTQWGRPDDTIGIAGVINRLEAVHQAYFAPGGLGILVGDGKLTNHGFEQELSKPITATLSTHD